jgi:hypothetical protein
MFASFAGASDGSTVGQVCHHQRRMGVGVRLFGALCVSANLPERADKAFWELSKRATAGTAERYYVSIT